MVLTFEFILFGITCLLQSVPVAELLLSNWCDEIPKLGDKSIKKQISYCSHDL